MKHTAFALAAVGLVGMVAMRGVTADAAPLSASSTAVPEPTSFLLATFVGLYGLGTTHRRKRK